VALAPTRVTQLLGEANKPLGVKEIIRLAGLHPGQQTDVKRVLRELLRAGEVQKEGKRFVLSGRGSAPASRGEEAYEPPVEPRAFRPGGRGRFATGPGGKHLAEEEQGNLPREPASAESGSRFGSRGAPVPGRFESRGASGRGRSESRPPAERGRFESRSPAGPGRFDARGQGGRGHAERGGGDRFESRGRAERGGRGGYDKQPARFERGGTGRGRDRFARDDSRGGRSAPPVDREWRPARGTAGRFPRGEVLEGVLKVHRDGFGFVRLDDDEREDVFLPPHEARKALDGDRVCVELVQKGGRGEGRLVEVLSRRRENVAGLYVVRAGDTFVVPKDSNLPGIIRVPRTQIAQDGDLVKVRLGVGADMLTPGEGLVGEVAGSLGKPGDPSGEVLSVAFSQGFNDEFPGDVMDEAARVPLYVSGEEAAGEGRRDLRDLPLVTIDGEDARDFDDAVYAEPTAHGHRLVVAIADVTHYVREHSALDREALSRATSVYLPNRVLPMLPERLSAGICSLRPDEDRLCMVADMEFDRAGRMRGYTLYPGVMRSQARCTYNEVQAVLDGEDVPHRNAFKPHFEHLLELSRTLRKMREKRGALDFDLPEYRVVLGEDGRPVRMEKRARKESHRLVEECMLAANEAVAKFCQDEGLPSIYRYHGEPDEEKLAAFADLAAAHGYVLRKSGKGEISPRDLADLLKQLTGHPESRALNQLLLRSMMQAVYSAEQVGHYGLAAEFYLHFTSPIRRYPDLIVHRLLKKHWARPHGRSEGELERETARLEEMAVQSSERERAAMQVEREVVSYYSVLLMKDRVGQEFAATVASVVDFGFFVELDTEHVEGLVKGESLGWGFKLDTKLHALTYPNGRKVRVGQKLKVRLASVNLERRQMDFEVVAFEGEVERREEATQERRYELRGPRREREERPRPAARQERRPPVDEESWARNREAARKARLATPDESGEGAPTAARHEPHAEAEVAPRAHPATRHDLYAAGHEAEAAAPAARTPVAPAEEEVSEREARRTGRFERPAAEAGRGAKAPRKRAYEEPAAESSDLLPRAGVPEAEDEVPEAEAEAPEAPEEFAAREASEEEVSPHPGFDRLRALARGPKVGRGKASAAASGPARKGTSKSVRRAGAVAKAGKKEPGPRKGGGKPKGGKRR